MPIPRPTRTPPPPTPTKVSIEVQYECAAGLRLERGEACSYTDGDQSDFVLAVQADGSAYLDGDIGQLSLSEKVFRPDAKVCACGLETEWDGTGRTIMALPEAAPAPVEALSVDYPLPPFLGECRIGMELGAGELCLYPGLSLCAFEVTQDGSGQFLTLSDRERIEARNVTHGELTYDFLAVASDGTWKIEDVSMIGRDSFRSEWIHCPPDQRVADLWDAIWRHDIVEVQRLIDSGMNVNARNDIGHPLLASAVFYSGHYQSTEIIERLISAGADVNAVDVHGTPTLHSAADDSTLGALQVLLEAGADPNARNARGASALSGAIQAPGATRALVNAGADANSLDRNGNPILHTAFLFGTPDVVRILLDSGADMNVTNTSGTPLILDAYSGGAEKLRLALESGANVDARGIAGRTALSSVTRYEFGEEYMQLIDAGANLDACDSLGNPPLVFALSSPDIRFTQALVRAGATVNTYDALGEPLLMTGIKRGDLEKIALLVEAGADVNARDSRGSTVLELARLVGSPEIVQYLIDAGAE